MHRTVSGIGKGIAKVIDRILADRENPHFTTADGELTWYPRGDVTPPSEDEEEEEDEKPKGPSGRAERYAKRGDGQIAYLEDELVEAVKEEKEESGSRKKKGKGSSAA
jgi:hypothetical protein